jgi:hypothetical protein
MSERGLGWNRKFMPLKGGRSPHGKTSSTSSYHLAIQEPSETEPETAPDSRGKSSYPEVKIVARIDEAIRALHEKAGFPVPEVLSKKSKSRILFAPPVKVNYEPYLEGIRKEGLSLPTWVYLTTKRSQTGASAGIGRGYNAGVVTLPITPDFVTGNQEEIRNVNEMLWLASLAVSRGSDSENANRASKAHNRRSLVKNLLLVGGIGGLAVVGITELAEAISAAGSIPTHAVHFPHVMQRITEGSVPAFVAGFTGEVLLESETDPIKLGINRQLGSGANQHLAERMAEEFKVLEPVL